MQWRKEHIEDMPFSSRTIFNRRCTKCWKMVLLATSRCKLNWHYNFHQISIVCFIWRCFGSWICCDVASDWNVNEKIKLLRDFSGPICLFIAKCVHSDISICYFMSQVQKCRMTNEFPTKKWLLLFFCLFPIAHCNFMKITGRTNIMRISRVVICWVSFGCYAKYWHD